MREATLDGAKPHDDVAARTDRLRRLASILIGQRVNANVRMVLLNRPGDGVDELEQ